MTFTHRRAEQLRAEAAHAQQTAVCPTCQVAPGTPCHDNGIQRPDNSPVHARRYEEATETAA
ncbi:zinc finger domain-containing protein [Streptomyces racemochromogenes]|uniref:zinc finger domain-containing protein n=1 Tax=Streptomyces racemochromogenes TaxID=67353 RepID=UPI0031EBBD0D